ncbi:DNA alkylation repair protein [Flavobacterium sp. JP2137]|uniref:DNA alkylation repair protein n=1 Tax=Flavobacterium sp. JP2137 TaxID=3414510 RepID=UPI003D2FBE92
MTEGELINRKGALKGALIPAAVLDLLNRGLLESVNLIEWSAVDHRKLVEQAYPELGLSELIAPSIALLQSIDKPSAMKNVAAMGQLLFEYGREKQCLDTLYRDLYNHTSDTIRSFSCFVIALQGDLPINHRLESARVLIADGNFGVREIIWMALRPHIATQLDEVLLYLQGWTADPDARIRRFVTEVTRPKGVWTAAIIRLKENPELALPLLEALRNDPALYVQNSVANWLNDSSKSQPEFVRSVCARWLEESNTKSTQYIVKRALRTLNK